MTRRRFAAGALASPPGLAPSTAAVTSSMLCAGHSGNHRRGRRAENACPLAAAPYRVALHHDALSADPPTVAPVPRRPRCSPLRVALLQEGPHHPEQSGRSGLGGALITSDSQVSPCGQPAVRCSTHPGGRGYRSPSIPPAAGEARILCDKPHNKSFYCIRGLRHNPTWQPAVGSSTQFCGQSTHPQV